MNRPIRRVAVVTMAMFALLLANVTYNVLVRQPGLNADPSNRRARDAEFGQDRGPILAVGSTELAITTPVEDQYRFQRSYPDAAEIYAPVTGFYSYDHARAALESSYNTELAGTDDSLFLRRLTDAITGARPTGATVQTTIVPKMQRAAWEGLAGRKGAVVALNPKTGAVLAMVSSPSYDPNELASHNIGAANKSWTRLNEDADKPMANRGAREIYPPGSTFKLVTAAAALNEGMGPESLVDSPAKLTLPDSGGFQLGNQTDCGGPRVSIDQALKVSCNTAFANLGIQLGADKLREQSRKFGFGSRPLPELAAAASQYPENPSPGQLAISAIGQGDVAASPLQMTMVTAGIANGGKVMEPYLVDTVRAEDLSVISQRQPTVRSEALSTDNAGKLRDMMVNVVNNGTGQSAQLSGASVGGKTGTAQTTAERPPYAWFTGFSSAEDPTVAVTVFIEEADIPRTDIAGGRLAGPIAKSVLEAARS